MRKRWVALTVGVVIVAVAVVVAPPLLVAALVASDSSSSGGTCALPGGDPGGAFQAGYLQTIDADGLSASQLDIAATIVSVGEQMQIPSRGIIVALATASQESGFKNYANDGKGGDLKPDQVDVGRSMDFPHDAVGTDHGSVNAFQQQYPWWGTLEELMDPPTAARKFYDALLAVDGWESMPVTVAAQRVQRSAYPLAYADDEVLATTLYDRLAGASGHVAGGTAGGTPTCGGGVAGGAEGENSTGSWSLPIDLGSYTLTSGYGPRVSPTGGSGNFHAGLDFGAPGGTPIHAAAGGTVTFAGWNNGGYGNLVIIHTEPNIDTYYAHQANGVIAVAVGDTVTSGAVIGGVGSTGDSTGNHLHFEVRIDGATVDPLVYLQQQGLQPGNLQ
jgi:murein DD-endopeptidase MepM/ murein hydrolase activator NlpD